MTNIDSLLDTDRMWRRACAVALAELPAMGPARLGALLADLPPELAWTLLAESQPLPEAVRSRCGIRYKELAVQWSKAVRRTEPLEVLERYSKNGVGVWSRLDDYPSALDNDPWAPAVLFWMGNPQALTLPRVAIIGTRHCTRDGRDIARRFGTELAEAGVSVVSGLALGIDGAAHTGALEGRNPAAPIAVVGNGLDIEYPKRHGHLYQQLKRSGLLVSEAPLGAIPEPWRFPARNRIIAGLADLVVVVESHSRGGSLLTVNEAAERGITVMAVPGSTLNPAAAGTNALLQDGAHAVCCTEDILSFLPTVWADPLMLEQAIDDPADIEILEAVDWQPTSTDDVMVRTGRQLGDIASTLARLEQHGWVAAAGGWWQRITPSNEDSSNQDSFDQGSFDPDSSDQEPS